MSSVILTNWTVYYADDAPGAGTGYKQIRWTGSGGPETDTNTVNELYTAITDLFSIAAQNNNDDTIPLRAVTPSVYEIGSFDQRDLEPWFIDPDSVEHLTNGSLVTVNWTRVTDADPNQGISGIVKVPYTVSGSQFVSTDIGRAIVNGTATGTLLWYDTTNSEAWVRPTNSTSTHDWAGPAGNILVTSGTGDVTQNGASVTGEREWPNIYSLGTISSGIRLSVFQGFAEVSNFWGDGHIDRLILTSDGFDAGLIDRGLLTVFARQYSQLYDHFIIDVSGGGRNPIPLATSDDVNNDSGYGSITLTGSTGSWNAGNFIYFDNAGGYTWATTTKKGVITSGGSGATPTLEYYLIGDLTDFSANEEVTEYDPTTGADGDANGDINGSGPSNVGPANPSFSYTIDFGATEEDIGDGNGNQPYDVSINLGGNTLSDFYEYTKYLTRRGNTADLDPGGDQTVDGEEYLTAGDVRLSYDTQTQAFLEGAILTGQTSGATGVITADHTTDDILIVRDVRGAFLDDENIQDDQGTPGSADILASGGIETTLVSKVAPFGTYAGGKFFGARGVWISNMAGADANSYELIDSSNTTRTPPATVSVQVSGVVSGDRVSVFRTTGDNEIINKTYLTSHATNNTTGNSSFIIQETIPSDTPTSGSIRVVETADTTSSREIRYTYTGWTTSTFTGLSPTLDRDYSGSDTAYVPYLDEESAGTSVSTSIQYDSDRNVLTRVRIKGIVPFKIKGTLDSTGYSTTAIRTTDSIVA